MSKVPARWERVQRAVEIRDELQRASASSKSLPDSSTPTLIIGNGDVLDMADAQAKAKESGADGIMIGRAIFGNPWFFHPTRRLPQRLTALPTHGVDREKIVTTDTTDASVEYVSLRERLMVMVEHTKLFSELLPHKNFAVMKKHFKAYVNGFPGAAELRNELMSQNTPAEIEAVVHTFLQGDSR